MTKNETNTQTLKKENKTFWCATIRCLQATHKTEKSCFSSPRTHPGRSTLLSQIRGLHLHRVVLQNENSFLNNFRLSKTYVKQLALHIISLASRDVRNLCATGCRAGQSADGFSYKRRVSNRCLGTLNLCSLTHSVRLLTKVSSHNH